MKITRSQRWIIAGSLVWCGLVVMAPVFKLETIYWLFHGICHQLPDRSWLLAGSPLAVCIRCTSIYFGFLIGSLGFIRPNSNFLLISTGAAFLEFGLARIILDSEWLRAGSGFALGLAVAPFIVLGVEEMMKGRYWQAKGVVRGSM